MNLLFICSRNEWRSRTAEDIFRTLPGHQVRSAGTSPQARVKVSEKHIQWADIIFAMEKKHREIIEERFQEAVTEKTVVVLNIPDDYQYMDEELISLLKLGLNEYLHIA